MAKQGRPKKTQTEEVLEDLNNEEVLEDLTNEEVVEEVVVEVVEEVVELPPHVGVEPDKVELQKPLGKTKGEVFNCNALRLREGANIRTSILTILPVGTKVEINLDNSTESFYEVTHNELIGFCLKQFISLG